MRQFGFAQPIYGPPDSHDYLHGITIKGRIPSTGQRDWSVRHAEYVALWNERRVVSPRAEFDEASWRAYISWFRPRSRLMLQPQVDKTTQPHHYRTHAKEAHFYVS